MVLDLPLLHVVQTASRATLDAPLVIAAAAVFAAVCVVLWRPQIASELAHRSGRRRVARAIVSVLAFLAVLPAVLPYDHIFAPHDDSAQTSAVHATHCHASPGTCSDVPVTSGPGELLFSTPLLPSVEFTEVLLEEAAPHVKTVAPSPLTPPPRQAPQHDL
jgi:hypothetical protein